MSKRKFQVGDLAILKSNLDKNYQKGDIVIITRTNYGGSYTIQPFEDTINIPNLWVSVRYLDTIDVNSDNPNINNVKQILMEKLIKDFTSRKEKLQQELQNIEDKLRYIEESGCTTFNENEFKVYKTLQLLEEKQGLSRMEKAQAIAKLISNK
jgi:hypothetical protein